MYLLARTLHARAIFGLTLIAFMCLAHLTGHLVSSARAEVITVGKGRGHLVFFDNNHNVIRRISGLNKVIDCSQGPQGTLFLAQEGSQQILEMTAQGVTNSVIATPGYPGSVRVNAAGELLITTAEAVLLIAADGTVKHTVKVQMVSEADFLQNGFVAGVISNSHGLVHMDWAGNVLRRSPARKDEPGYVSAIYSVDSNEDDSVLVSEGVSLVLLNRDLQIVRKTDASKLRSRTFARRAADGRVVTFASGASRQGVVDTQGVLSVFSSLYEPTCATLLRDGGYVVGYTRRAENSWPLGKTRHETYIAHPPTFSPSSLAGVLGAFFVVSLGFTTLLRRRTARRTGIDAQAPLRDTIGVYVTNRDQGRHTCAHTLTTLALIAAVVVGAGLTWQGAQQLLLFQFQSSLPLVLGGSVLAGVALRLLSRRAHTTPDFISFSSTDTTAAGRNVVIWPLIIFALVTLGACMSVQAVTGDTKWCIGLWVAAQVLFVGSFLSARAPSSPMSTMTAILSSVVLIVAIVARFWELGAYPDRLHHDHGMVGTSALTFLYGDWNPFFVVDPLTQTYMRPWMIPMASFFYLFGPEPSILRLSNALWGVGLVIGGYLVGTALSSRRLGIVCAALVAVQHSLLIYTRQAYVVESTAPFVFSIYCIIKGLRSGALSSWAWAGVWVTYSMLSIRQCTTFPFIWATLFACCCIYMPRLLWQQRRGILTLIATALVIYLPFIPNLFAPANGVFVRRLEELSALLGPNFTLNPNLDVWKFQFGRSFGSFLIFSDASPWGVTTNAPIFVGCGAVCFCIGLVYLLCKIRSPIPVIITIPIIVSTTLGSAMLHSPPTYYHYFVGITFAILVAAIPIERLWAIGATMRSRIGQTALCLSVVFLVGCFYRENLMIMHDAVRRPTAARDLPGPWAPNIHSVMALYVGDNRDARFYIIRDADPLTGFSSNDSIFHFYGFFSDISDMIYDLDEYLPLPPTHNQRVVFFLMPERAGDRSALQSVYPHGVWSQIFFGNDLNPIDVLTVRGDEIQEAHAQQRKPTLQTVTEKFRLTPAP